VRRLKNGGSFQFREALPLAPPFNQIHWLGSMSETDQPAPFTRRQLFGYLTLCMIWGSTWLAIREVVSFVPPLEAAGLRFLAAGFLLVGLAWLQKRKWPRGERQWNAILVLSLTMMAIPFGLVFWAEQHIVSSMTAILYSASPLVVSLLTPIFLHRKVPRSAVFAMVVAFGGIAALIYTEVSVTRSTLLGGTGVFVAMLISACSTVYAKTRLHDIDPMIATGLQLLFGSIPLLCGTWAFEAHRQAVWNAPALASLAFLTVFGSCVAFVVYYWLLKTMQPYQLTSTGLLVPIVAVLEGALLKREPVPWMMVGVIVVVLVCVGSALRAEAIGEREVDILMLRDKPQ
jgi:drug/metabolite transporter (DMT)-like permease